MNHTPSGAVAVGAPGSLARHIAELEHFEEHNHAWALLLATDEGHAMLMRFGKSRGVHFPQINMHGNPVEWLEKNAAEFTSFAAGFKLAYSLL